MIREVDGQSDPAQPDPAHLNDDFGRDLKKLYGARSVPTSVDAAILSAARTPMLARRRRKLQRFLLPGAAAAALALGCFLWLDQRVGSIVPGVALASDVDGSGTVDILDAFVLEGRIARGDVAARFDFNGDGAVNSVDVERVARRAVKLR